MKTLYLFLCAVCVYGEPAKDHTLLYQNRIYIENLSAKGCQQLRRLARREQRKLLKCKRGEHGKRYFSATGK